MKRLLLISLILGISVSVFSQNHSVVPKEIRNYAVKRSLHISQHPTDYTKTPSIPSYKSDFPPEEEIIGNTYYDLQTNTSCQNRFYVYDDGTMGATWTFGIDYPGFGGDRGTGYNYFDGENWGSYPVERIESLRTGWPSYAPYGENGELVVSHDFGAGSLYLLKRDEKGTGEWSEDEFLGPDNQKISWNRTTTSGVNNDIIQMLSITWPSGNGGTVYEGLDGAILYSRSQDGGQSWDPENVILDGMDASLYSGFRADAYDWATDGDNIAFLVGESWYDLFLMKSTDGGDNWEKTVIWECPYPMFSGAATDTFYCPDGAHHLAFDADGMVHVVFGINRAYSDGAGQFWFPFIGGIGYWNEDRPVFSNDLNALCPFTDCTYSELVDDYSLIGWTQDVDGDGEVTLTDDVAPYYLGLSSMPQIMIDNDNFIYVVYSSVTETYDDGTYNYRHLWARTSIDGGETWDSTFVDLTSDLEHIFDECVFPSIASNSTAESFYLVYQTDNSAGMAVRPDPGTHPYIENYIRFMDILKEDVIDGVEENNMPIFDYDVLQNSPNPFTGTTTVQVNIRKAANLSLEVVNMMGQKIYTVDAGYAKTGMNKIIIDGTKLRPGVYFYTVKAGEGRVTKKMIVE